MSLDFGSWSAALANRWTCEQCGALLEVDEDASETRCLNGHTQVTT